MDSSTKLIIPSQVLCEEVDGETVILNLQAGLYFSLNSTGTDVWKMIQRHGRLGEVKKAMQQIYGALSNTIDEDVEAVVDRLVDKGLLIAEPSH